MFAGSSLTEKGVVAVISAPDSLVRWHLTIRLNAMLETVQLPTGITNLGTSLADVDRNALTLQKTTKQKQLD